MDYQSFIASTGFNEWALLSFALFVISKKLDWKKRWPAWIPGYRLYCLGDSVGLSREGMYCGIMDLLFINSVIANHVINKEVLGDRESGSWMPPRLNRGRPVRARRRFIHPSMNPYLWSMKD